MGSRLGPREVGGPMIASFCSILYGLKKKSIKRLQLHDGSVHRETKQRQFLYSTQGGADAAPHTPGWVWAGPYSCIGRRCQGRPVAADGEDSREGAEPAAAAAAPRSRRRRGQRRRLRSKPVILGLGVRALGFGGGELAGAGDGGCRRRGLEGWWAAVDRRRGD
jgi:hypothetical protein